MDSTEYAHKLERMESKTLLPALAPQSATFIREIASRYRFTYQELRQVAQAARDLSMWRESELLLWWQEAERGVSHQGRERKKALLGKLDRHLRALASTEKRYPEQGLAKAPRRRMALNERDTARQILGPCPAYSEKTVCCGLQTLDAVRGCPFSCSYCTIQTFYDDTAEIEADLGRKLADLDLDPSRRYHIGTGQSSDSLVWGNRAGILDELLDFAHRNPNVLLELKTKSDNVRHLLRRDIPANVVCSWTLNTPTLIRNEEQGAASLGARLDAARRLADRRVAIGFHFHPMVYYSGWSNDYPALVETVQRHFAPDDVAFVSMGTVTLIKPVIQEIRRRGGQTKILQMEMVADHHGKLTYPDEIKIRLFGALYSAFAPWHDRVFFYLCMETAAIWKEILGSAFASNVLFETAFLDHCLAAQQRLALGRAG